jgi:hypothetical protein
MTLLKAPAESEEADRVRRPADHHANQGQRVA